MAHTKPSRSTRTEVADGSLKDLKQWACCSGAVLQGNLEGTPFPKAVKKAQEKWAPASLRGSWVALQEMQPQNWVVLWKRQATPTPGPRPVEAR